MAINPEPKDVVQCTLSPKTQKEWKRECDARRGMLLESPKSTTLFTWDEVRKLIKAFEEKYNISPCNGLPYEMKSIDVVLSGEVIKGDNT